MTLKLYTYFVGSLLVFGGALINWFWRAVQDAAPDSLVSQLLGPAGALALTILLLYFGGKMFREYWRKSEADKEKLIQQLLAEKDKQIERLSGDDEPKAP